MHPRKFHPIWRILAGLISLAILAMLALGIAGVVAKPGWRDVLAMVPILTLFPWVSITGRAPGWFERWTHRDV